MTQTRRGPRERLIVSAIELVRQRGVEGTGLTQLLDQSGTARRSIYQHFPGGKNELIAASTTAAGQWVTRGIQALTAEHSTAETLRTMMGRLAADLVEHDYALGCPIAAAALSTPEAAGVRTAAADTFARWTDELAASLEREGRTSEQARSLAGFAVSALEGALLRARAEKSTAALDEAAAHLTTLLSVGGTGS